MKKIVLSIFILAFLSGSANAQLILIENFAYTTTGTPSNDTLTNPALGGAIWKRHSGNAGPITWNATNLTYAGYAGSAMGGSINVAHASGSREDANVGFDSVNTGSIYSSFLLKVTDTVGPAADYFMHYGATSGIAVSNFTSRLYIKKGDVPNTFKLGILKGSTAANAVFSLSDYVINQTYLIVLKYTFNASTQDDVASVYIISSGVPAVEPVTADITSTDVFADNAKISALCLRQGTGNVAKVIIGGVRIGKIWNESPLPIKISNFNAIGFRNSVNLNWLINADESNSIDIERSVNGVNFEKIITVNNNQVGNYNNQVTDNNLPNISTLYYRLKLNNQNGKYEYSNVQKVTLRDVKLTVSPNPASNEILVNSIANISSVELFDLTGKRIYSNQNNTTNSVRISIATLPEGTYVVKTIIEGELSTDKIVIKH